MNVWLIRKAGAFYRPKFQGYTTSIVSAGLYSREEAEREVSVEPQNISAHHISEFRSEIERDYNSAKHAYEALLGAANGDDALPVYTAWDLGYRDETVIGWYQVVRGEVHVIDAYEVLADLREALKVVGPLAAANTYQTGGPDNCGITIHTSEGIVRRAVAIRAKYMEEGT